MHIIIDANTKKVIGRFGDSHDAEARDFVFQTNRNGHKCWAVYMTKEEYLNYTRNSLDKYKKQCYN